MSFKLNVGYLPWIAVANAAIIRIDCTTRRESAVVVAIKKTQFKTKLSRFDFTLSLINSSVFCCCCCC